jgi:hypothetical protein
MWHQFDLEMRATYNFPAIDSYNKVEPRLDAQLQVGIAQNLESIPALLVIPSLLLGVAVQAGYEAI